MRALLLLTLIAFFIGGCEKTIKEDARSNDAKSTLASSR
jgi:hypothetical protein